MPPLRPLAFLFLRLGTTAFGGPAAHIALMHQEMVERRAWISDPEFLDLLAVSNMIPGPSSTELAIHIGYKLAGWRGLILAGLCFILPAALLVGLLASVYQTYGTLPKSEAILRAIKPVVVAIVLQALRGLATNSLRTMSLMLFALAALVLSFLGIPPLLILLLSGSAMVAFKLRRGSALLSIPLITGMTTGSITLLGVFGAFLKIGSLVFGSGYVLLAFLQSDLVDNRHWLTTKQLLDAVAVGQFTPGPVFTTATFIGFLLKGPVGAVAATFGIFLPGFILVAFTGPLVPRLRNSRVASAFLDGVTAASVALIASVLLVLGRAALVGPVTIAIAVSSFILLTRFKLNTAWLIAAAALIGLVSNPA